MVFCNLFLQTAFSLTKQFLYADPSTQRNHIIHNIRCVETVRFKYTYRVHEFAFIILKQNFGGRNGVPHHFNIIIYMCVPKYSLSKKANAKILTDHYTITDIRFIIVIITIIKQQNLCRSCRHNLHFNVMK